MTDPAPGTRSRAPRRTLRSGAAALAVLVTLGAVSCSQDDEPTAQAPDPGPRVPSASASESPEPSATGRLRSEVSLTMLPAVAQPGPAPAPAGEATPVLTATVEPAVDGGEVVLQRAGRDGWSEVARTAQEPSGRAVFSEVPASGDARYRALVVQNDARSRPGPALDAAPWEPTFSDEFDGRSLDQSRWGYRQVGEYNTDGGRACSTSDESAVAVAEGALRLSVLEDPDRTGQQCRSEDGTFGYYLNGHVSTAEKFEFTHGIAAARVKFQRERGQHGAFWLQRSGIEPVAGRPDVSGAEIDVAEFFGEGFQGDGLFSFVYYLNAQGEDEKVGGRQPGANRLLRENDSWWDRYHVFSVEWSPERYVFRVDGREYYRTTEGVSGVDQYLVLSLLSSDWELRHLDESALPTAMDVDWVRVWPNGPA